MTDDAAGHLLHNIFAVPSEPGPPYTHTVDLTPPDPAEAVAWLRGQIEGDKALALLACCQGDGVWAVRHDGCDEECPDPCPKAGQCHAGYCWHCTVEGDSICIYDEGGHDGDQAAHIARHDPQDVTAGCEAKLAILDEHGLYDVNDEAYCRICGDCPQVPYPCRTVSLLAAGFRHREGYARFWGTPVTHTLTEDGQ